MKKYFYIVLGIIFFSTLYYFQKENIIQILLAAILIVKAKFIPSIMKFFSASKVKTLMFLKTLTFVKVSLIGAKRFIIDNVLSKWIQEHIIKPISDPVKGYWIFFKKQPFKEKIKKLLIGIVPISVLMFLLSSYGLIEGTLLYAEIKAIVIGFFKLLWIFAGKALSFLSSSWISSIIEVLALSWVFDKIAKIPFIGRFLTEVGQYLGCLFRSIYRKISYIWNKYILKHVNKKVLNKVKTGVKKSSEKMSKKLTKMKEKNEIYLIKEIMKDIPFYFNQIFEEPLKTREEKIEYFKQLNKITNDNVFVIGFYDNGRVWKDKVNTVLVLESFASLNNSEGNNEGRIRKEHFWLVNLTDNNFKLNLKGKTYIVKPNKMRLLKLEKGNIHYPKHSFKFIKI